MKRGIIYILFILLLMQLVSAGTNSVLFSPTGSNVDIRVSIVRYVPIPAEPGQFLDLYVSLESQERYGTSIVNYKDLQDVQLEFVESYPFTLASDADAVQSFGNLEQGERVTTVYRIHVDDTAPSGDHEITFIYRDATYGDGFESPPLDITIEARDTTLSILDITTEPEQLEPGSPATLSITIRNDALQAFRNLNAVIDIDNTSIPIVPFKSSKEQSLRDLAEGQEYTFEYSIIAEEDAAAGVYKIPFTLTYNDANNTIITRKDTFGILIGAEGDLEFNLEEFDTFQKNTQGEVVVSVSNTGPSELKFMTLELLESEDYVILGRNKEYLGNLDSDDFETSTFDIHTKTRNDIPLQLQVTYKDAYNEEFTEQFVLLLPVYTAGEVSAYGLDGKTKTYVTYIIYALIAFFIFYIYQGWRKHKKIDKTIGHGLKQIIKLPFRILMFFHPKNLRRLPKKIKLFFSDL